MVCTSLDGVIWVDADSMLIRCPLSSGAAEGSPKKFGDVQDAIL